MEAGADTSKTPLLEADEDGVAYVNHGGSGSRPFMQSLTATAGREYRGLVQDEDAEQGQALVGSAEPTPHTQDRPPTGEADVDGYNSCEESDTSQDALDQTGPREPSSASGSLLSHENLAKLDQRHAYDETWLERKTGRVPPPAPPLPDLPFPPPPSLPSHAVAEYQVPTLPPQPAAPSSAAAKPRSRSSSSSSKGGRASDDVPMIDHQPATSSSEPPQEREERPMAREGSDRHCFMCLGEDEPDNQLYPCCTTCYARVHIKCWKEWRHNQRITALRSRLLGLRMQSNNLLRCTICKSGTAVVTGEEGGLEWMNDMLCAGTDGNAREVAVGGLAAALARREESDGEGDGFPEELADTKTCVALVVYLSILVVVLLTTCVLIFMHQFYAYDVVLCCIMALYELSILQLVGLAIIRRRSAMVAAAQPREERRFNPEEVRELPV
mmetsp:Transcript_293/g.999  ORF Transcript_293/g.999 Transcript_293/m.999 type:complete len:441 (+) Transcript_293:92-1414(+)